MDDPQLPAHEVENLLLAQLTAAIRIDAVDGVLKDPEAILVWEISGVRLPKHDCLTTDHYEAARP